MNQNWRDENIRSLVSIGLSVQEAVRIVEGIIDNNGMPAVTDTISREDIIDAMAEWAVQSPITEANILNAS
jgi:antitoxin component of RelBE/YafQ-DinJ toxin-antitoxin module